MKFLKLLILGIISMLFITSCTVHPKLLEEKNTLNIEISQLKEQLNNKNKEVINLSNKLNQLEELKYELEKKVKSMEQKSIDLYKENLELVLELKDITINEIKELMGDPIKVEKYLEAHGNGNVIELIYNKAKFTFNKYEEKETLKSYRINNSFFSTKQGIRIGSTRDDIIKAYGKKQYDYIETDDFISFGEKPSGIRFILTENVVSEIHVWLEYE